MMIYLFTQERDGKRKKSCGMLFKRKFFNDLRDLLSAIEKEAKYYIICIYYLFFSVSGYLEQSFPSIHNSRLYLDSSSRVYRSGVNTITSGATLPKDLSPDRHPQKVNGSIYLSPQTTTTHHPSPTTT